MAKKKKHNKKQTLEEVPIEELHQLIRRSIELNSRFGEHVKECKQCRDAHQNVLCEQGYDLWYQWVIFPTEPT